nr:PREDICTED: forkhead box protein D1-like [Anolis carolinensis]|eukprot:XP_016853151.1 PREDICTED: forkhead box protein D1-like [Anolis carolinensis]
MRMRASFPAAGAGQVKRGGRELGCACALRAQCVPLRRKRGEAAAAAAAACDGRSPPAPPLPLPPPPCLLGSSGRRERRLLAAVRDPLLGEEAKTRRTLRKGSFLSPGPGEATVLAAMNPAASSLAPAWGRTPAGRRYGGDGSDGGEAREAPFSPPRKEGRP